MYLVFRRCCGCSCTQLQTHFRSLRSAADELTATLASRGTQTIGTSRHRYQSQSHFAIALELAYRHYHFSMADRAASNKEFQNRGFQQGIPTTAMTPLASPALIPASAHRQVAPPCTPLVRELHLASQLHSRFGSPPSASQLSLRSLWVSCSSPQLSPRFSVALKCRRSLHVSSARCGTVWRELEARLFALFFFSLTRVILCTHSIP